jgi:hypothetical protein
MATKKDWQGYYNVLKEVEYNEETFTFIVLYSFINMYYLDTDITALHVTEEIENFQNALEDVLNIVRDFDNHKKTILKVIK